MLASSFAGTTHVLNSDLGYSVVLPSNLFTGSTITDTSSAIRMLSVTWLISPLLVSPIDTFRFDSHMISLMFLDSNREAIIITGKSILLQTLHYDTRKLSDSAYECKSYSSQYSDKTISEATCTVISTVTGSSAFSGCSGCGGQQELTVLTSHLSSFVVGHSIPSQVVYKEFKGVGTKQEDIEAHPKIYESQGVFYLLSIFGLFILGNLMLIPFS